MNLGEPAELAGVALPLVKTKLVPPILADGTLDRPAVIEPLLSTRRLAVVSAPAGWGKTSLLAAWRTAEAERRRFAYVRLSPGDNLAPMFWSYVVGALRTLEPALVPGAEELLRRPTSDPLRDVLPTLVNGLSTVDEPIVLVLDDYHVINNDEIHVGLRDLVANLPSTVAIAIGTRSDPPLSLARLRASDDLVEIRAADLAFDPDETSAFFHQRFDLDLEDADARQLCIRTDGWPAGLHLAGLSLEHGGDSTTFIERFAGDDRNVADYLVEEVMSTLGASRREFLLRTSVLAELSGSLCDAVAGRDDSAAVLEQLERDGLFVVPLDHQRDWYRYHHLFGDWLLHELRATDPDVIPELHRQASQWHEQHASLDEAIHHALAIPDRDRAVDLVAQHLDAGAAAVNWPQVWQWLDQLPDGVLARQPHVALARARLAFDKGAFAEAMHWIETSERGAAKLPEPRGSELMVRLRVWRSMAELVDGDMETALRLAEALADDERAARSWGYASAVGIAGVATFWLIGALESIPLLVEASTARADTGVEDGGVTALLSLAHAEVGDWSSAQAVAERALTLPNTDSRNRYPVDMAAFFAQGLAATARGDRAGGTATIEMGLELARAWVEPLFIAYGCLLLSDVSGDYAEKRALVREARQLVAGVERRTRVHDLVDAEARSLAIRQPSQDTAGTVFVEPLTERELQVLRLLRSDLSLREIARELSIAHNTVKGYTKSIYRKLGVSSREAAIRAASELDLG